MTEDSPISQLAKKCVLVKNVPLDNTDTVLKALFPAAIRWATGYQTRTAIVLFDSPSDVGWQLSCPKRDCGEDIVEIVKCPPAEIPKDLVESYHELSPPESSVGVHDQLWSLHSYPGAGSIEHTAISPEPSATYAHHTNADVLSGRSYSYPFQDQQDHMSFEGADFSGIHSKVEYPTQDNQVNCEDHPQVSQHAHPVTVTRESLVESNIAKFEYSAHIDTPSSDRHTCLVPCGGDISTVEYPDSQSSAAPIRDCDPHLYPETPPPSYLSSCAVQDTTSLKSVLPQYTESPPPSYSDAVSTRGGMSLPETPQSVLNDQERELTKITHRSAMDSDAECQCIEVSSLPEGVDMEELKMYFSNKRRHGGGEIKSITMNPTQLSAVIEFQHPSAVKRVLGKCPLLIRDKMIHVQKHFVNAAEADQVNQSHPRSQEECVVKVTGLPADVGTDYIVLYFENSKYSGGGEVKDVKFRKNGSVLITFVHNEDAESVLAKPEHVIMQTKINVSRWQRPEQRTLKVSGLIPSVNEEMLELYFENEKKSGGGNTTKIQMMEQGSALVTFQEEEVCLRVLKRKDLVLGKVPLCVALWEEEDKEPSRAIIVSGFDPKTPEEMIKLLFENERKSKGGEIEKLEFIENGSAQVTFKDIKVAERVLEYGKSGGIKMGGKTLSISACTPKTNSSHKTERKSANLTDTIQVSGLSNKVSAEIVQLYFENTRRSGGGNVSDVSKEDDGTMLIKFHDPQVVKSVLSRNDHVVDGVKLQVTPHDPPRPVPMDPTKVFIQGVSHNTTYECLIMYIERCCGQEPMRIVQGEKAGTYMLLFRESVDLAKFQQSCKERPLEKCYLSVSGVPISNSIRVTNLHPKITKDTLQLYFESEKRSHGGPVQDVELFKEEAYALVHFNNHTDLNQVLQNSHVLEEQKLSVCVHYDCLGLVSLDGTALPIIIPKPIEVPLNPHVLEFILTCGPNQQALEQELLPLGAEVDWRGGPKEGILVRCSLEKKEKNRQQIARWKETVSHAVAEFMKVFQVQKVDCLQETWPQIIERLKSPQFDLKAGGLIIPNDQSSTIVVVGHRQMVEKCVQDVETLKKGIEGEIERQKKSIKEVKDLKHFELLYLKIQRLKETVQTVEIKLCFQQNQIEFVGLPTDIDLAKVTMYELLHSKKSFKLDLSPCICEFMKSGGVKKFLAEKLREKSVKAVWDLQETHVTVFAATDKHLVEGTQLIKTNLTEAEINIKEESSPLLSSQPWHNMVNQLKEMHPGLIQIILKSDNTQVNIVTTSDLMGEAQEVVQGFLKENTIISELCQLDSGTARFVDRYKREEIKSLEAQLQQFSVSIEVKTHDKGSGLQVKGSELGIRQAKVKLEEMTGKVTSKRYHVDKPGYPKYLISEKGMEFLSTVELKHQVVICESSKQDASMAEEEFVMVSKQSSDKHTIKASVSLPGNRTIMVVKGDMTKYRVDAMVNAANDRLQHIGGLAAAILRKGGPSIQAESDVYISEHGKLLEGNVAMTGSGNLPCKAVIHAVGPIWRGGQQTEEDLLGEAVFESLDAASEKGLRSISIPALSTGVFGYPLAPAVNIIVKSILDFFKEEPKSSVGEVHLIDVGDRTVMEFVTALVKNCGSEKVQMFGDKPVPAKRNLTWKNTTVAQSQNPVRDPTSGDVKTRSGMKIPLVKGELAKQTVDVLVNSTGKDLALKNGAVSNSLLKAAGPQLQAEASQRYPNGVTTHGEVLVTQGYKLSCKAVYHGSLKGYDATTNTSTKVLEQFIMNCLTKAQTNGFTSIAFPALGTGNLHFPDAVVAKIMYETAIKFSDDNPKSCLRTVSFVVFPASKSTVKAFEDQRRKLSGLPHEATVSHRRKNRKYNSLSMEGNTPGRAPVQEEEIFPLQKIRFSVSQGDITKAGTDAIVNSTNEALNLNQGAVSSAILKAAGDQLQQDCKSQVKKMKAEGCVVTGAGRLRCRHVIHIDAQSSPSWKSKIKKCLEAANKMELSSVSFPAVGTGVGKKNPEEMAEDMYGAINEFQSKLQDTLCITDVQLIVFEESMVNSVKKGLRNCFSRAGATPKSFFRKAWDSLTGMFAGGEADTASTWEASPAGKRKSPKEIALVVISDKKEAIEKAISNIESCLKSEMYDQVITEPWTESIKNLSDQHVAEILTCENKQDVTIKIEKRLGRIRIQGLPTDVMTTFQIITTIFKEIDRMVHETKTSEVVAGIVQWYYMECNPTSTSVAIPLTKYDNQLNMVLEKAFLQKEKMKVLTADDGCQYCYDFEAMEEYPDDDPSDRVKMIRKEVNAQSSGFELPPTWTHMADQDLVTVELQSTDSEYQQVIKNLQGQVTNIIKIERIQNKSLYEQYVAKKGKIERSNPNKTVEKILWHGTSSDTVQSINNYGFNRSYCGKNATAFGNGVYFAVNANYSASNTYSRPDGQGHKRMYQTRVLVGDHTQGRSGMIVPPNKSGPILYDSVVDNPANPSMYIIFHDAQAYPDYLVTFQ
ncbi:protein mono-ADP-ribosyltransferase PARP14-like [Liolophura sinensis]|uniref:protein mono-ADP-ribosyltransferase PARP14-like n=1 Tax=Liolophura sinensis TaxID=3198878 RepID=UPI0031589B11